MNERKNPILMAEVTHVLIRDVEESVPNIVFKHANRQPMCAEELEIEDIKEGVWFAVTDIVLYANGDEDSQRTSIVVPYSEIPELIKALTAVMDSK